VRLRAVLLNHLAPGRLVLGKRQIRTLLGTPVFVSAEGPHRLGETEVITADLEAANGLLHVIDAVLVPLGEQPGTNDEVAELIDNAISLGVPLYNGGNAEVCAAIYEVAAVSAMDAKAPGLSRDLRDTLRSSIDEAARQVDKQVAAWTLRRALDTARQAVR
jgi:hypothetical protein